MTYRSVNPFNGELLASFDNMTDDELEAAIRRAQDTFERDWRRMGVSGRCAVLKRAAGLLREKRDMFARLVTLEMGKLWNESRAEVDLSADILEFYADSADHLLSPKTLSVAEGEALVENEPVGIVFCVEPWNFPYYQLARVVGPSFALGNVIMVKHASNVPQCAQAFERLLFDAGAPAGAYTNMFATKGQVERTIADFRVKAVALTGSEEAGSVVAAQAGKSLKKSTLELGGSDAFIVLDDADLDRAVAWAVWGRLNNTGQCCIASKRLIVVESLADEFLSRFKASLEQLRAGDPFDPTTNLGPLSSEGALDTLLRQIEDAVANGATLVSGGKRLARAGAFIEAGVLTDLQPSNPAYYQEFFGPVALFFRVKDEAEAIAVANDSQFGLGGSVFTQDVERGKSVARQLETGMVFINQATWTAPDLPFGGINRSGYGRELSELGMQEFVNKKLIRVSSSLPDASFPVA